MNKLINLLKNKGFKVEKRRGHIKVSTKNSTLYLDQNTSGELLNVFSLTGPSSEKDGIILTKNTKSKIFEQEIFPVIDEKHFDKVSSNVQSLLLESA